MYRISRIARSLSRNASIQKRHASTEGAAPGIPPAAQPTRTPTTFMSFAMPDTQPPPPPPEVQIPFAPDFWASSSKALPDISEPELPKLNVVTDVGTKHSHNLFPDPSVVVVQEAPLPVPPVAEQGKGGILQDMSEDLGIPSLRAGLSNFFQKR